MKIHGGLNYMFDHVCCGASAKTKNSCIMLAFARPRVESKLTIHCEGSRERRIAHCESKRCR